MMKNLFLGFLATFVIIFSAQAQEDPARALKKAGNALKTYELDQMSNMDKLHALKFTGMLQALEEQLKQIDIHDLTFEERLALMLDRELTVRESRRLASRLKKAKLKQPACMEDIDFKHPRGLSWKSLNLI